MDIKVYARWAGNRRLRGMLGPMTKRVVKALGPRGRSGDVIAPDGLDLGFRRGEVGGPPGPDAAGRSARVGVLQGRREGEPGARRRTAPIPRRPAAVNGPGPGPSDRMNSRPPS